MEEENKQEEGVRAGRKRIAECVVSHGRRRRKRNTMYSCVYEEEEDGA